MTECIIDPINFRVLIPKVINKVIDLNQLLTMVLSKTAADRLANNDLALKTFSKEDVMYVFDRNSC
jgi:hypothetical protein